MTGPRDLGRHRLRSGSQGGASAPGRPHRRSGSARPRRRPRRRRRRGRPRSARSRATCAAPTTARPGSAWRRPRPRAARCRAGVCPSVGPLSQRARHWPAAAGPLSMSTAGRHAAQASLVNILGAPRAAHSRTRAARAGAAGGPAPGLRRGGGRRVHVRAGHRWPQQEPHGAAHAGAAGAPLPAGRGRAAAVTQCRPGS